MMMSTSSRKTLARLFREMDLAFDRIARGYGFVCRGCEDNCCQSVFFHHTFIEKAYLHYGLTTLEPWVQKEILEKARAYAGQEVFFSKTGDMSEKPMCPLLENGRCRLYVFRPMICRLHGLPHEMSRPGHCRERHPGCRAGNFEVLPYLPFDRTPFYRQMAEIEMAFRKETGQNGKLKQTIARMILDVPLFR